MTTEATTDDHPVIDDQSLFRRLHGDLRRFAWAVADSDQDGDDVLQEAVARTLQRGPLSDLDDPAAYLRTAVVRVVANHRRSSGRRRAHVRAVRLDTTTEDAYPSQAHAVLDGLSGTDRALLVLVAVEGRTIEEAAGLCDLRAGTARSRLSRVRARLQQHLDDDRGATS